MRNVNGVQRRSFTRTPVANRQGRKGRTKRDARYTTTTRFYMRYSDRKCGAPMYALYSRSRESIKKKEKKKREEKTLRRNPRMKEDATMTAVKKTLYDSSLLSL